MSTWTPLGYVWMSQYFPSRGVVTAEFTWGRTRRQFPLCRVCLFPYGVQHPAVAWGGLCSSLHLARCFAHWQLSLSVWDTNIPVSLPVSLVDTFLSPDLGWLDSSVLLILSQAPSHRQIPVIRHIWAGVGFVGCRQTAVSLQFATAKKRKNFGDLAVFKPLIISVSHSSQEHVNWSGGPWNNSSMKTG